MTVGEAAEARPGEEVPGSESQSADDAAASDRSSDHGAVPALFDVTEAMHPRIDDSVRTVLNRYELATGVPPPGVIAVVSALAGEGVTTVSRALAEVLTIDYGASVCLMDLAWSGRRRPRRSPPRPGLVDVVDSSDDATDVRAMLVEQPGNPRLKMLPSGELPERGRGALVRSSRVLQVFDELSDEFDYLVMDCAPVLSGSEGVGIIRRADAYLLVARYGASTGTQLEAAVDELRNIETLGAVLNGYRTKTPKVIRRLLDG